MIYGKLPVTFLSAIANEKYDSINSTIARYILAHLNDLRSLGIEDIARRCNVSSASLSRFCKDIGLQNFAELRELLDSNQLNFEQQQFYADAQMRCIAHMDSVITSIQQVASTVDLKKIQRLCHEIYNHKYVAAFGHLKAGAASINLQSDLLMQGKQIYTNYSYPQQLKYISKVKADTLVIIFSYTGAYFDYQRDFSIQMKANAPSIWIISGQKRRYPPFVTEAIHFSSLHNQASHPYQLLFISSLISHEYGNLYGKESPSASSFP